MASPPSTPPSSNINNSSTLPPPFSSPDGAPITSLPFTPPPEEELEPLAAPSLEELEPLLAPPSLPSIPHPGSSAWDPELAPEWDSSPASFHCLNRIKRDLATIYREPPPGMFVMPDKDDMTKIHAMIIGPFDTPYEGGFFHFLVRCPPNYPINPPRVKLLTTGGNTVRFNPNFYRNGKVCLSILGTWSGPAWSPALSLSSLLISIQSLMTDKPYHNEPGYETERAGGDVRRYNLIVQHETLRVAVLENLEKWRTGSPAFPSAGSPSMAGTGSPSMAGPGSPSMGGPGSPRASSPSSPLYKPARTALPDFMEHFETACREQLHRDGEDMRDPFGERRGRFQWAALQDKLAAVREANPTWFLLAEEGEGPSSDVSELSED